MIFIGSRRLLALASLAVWRIVAVAGVGRFSYSSSLDYHIGVVWINQYKCFRSSDKLFGKHCQRHNGPRVLSLKLELSLQLE